MVVANKQGHPMTSAATGIQTVIQLSLAGPAETADFVSIPGSQPAINWSATLTPLSAANPYQLLPPLMFPVGQFSQLPATQGALALPNPPLPTTTASTIKLDASLLCSLPTMSGAQASQPGRVKLLWDNESILHQFVPRTTEADKDRLPLKHQLCPPFRV